VERFREIYLQVTAPVVYASEYVLSGLLLARAHGNPAHWLLYNLIDKYLVPPCRSAKYRLDLDMAIGAVPLETIISDLQCLLSKYGTLIGVIDQAARAILSQQEYYGSEWYSGLHQRHKECLRELNRISQRAKFENLRPALALLYDLLTVQPLPPGPRVLLHGEDAFHVKRVPWNPGEMDVLGVRLINSPSSHAESAVAKGFGAEFTCEGGGSVQPPWIHARNDHSPQPPKLSLGQLPELICDLGIDKWIEYNLVIKEPNAESCYLFNNDSYQHPRGQNPAWRIGPGEHKIVVRVSGVAVREQFECIFINPGPGRSLLVKSFKALPP
jgi:hypothetical protein